MTINLTPEDLSPTVFDTHGHVHFISDSSDGGPLSPFLTGGTNLIETGLPQTLMTSPVTVTFTSDLNAVPEPATMLLLGSGILGLVGLRRKFKK